MDIFAKSTQWTPGGKCVAEKADRPCLCQVIKISINRDNMCPWQNEKSTSLLLFDPNLETQSKYDCLNQTPIQGHSPIIINKESLRTSLVVQLLRLCAPHAGDLGLIPGQGTRSHMPQLRVCMLQAKVCMPQWRSKVLRATTKTQNSQTNKYFF